MQMRNSIQNKTINTALLRSRSRRSLDRGDAQQAAQEHKEPQGDAQQVEEGGSGTWLHAGATKHRAKVAVHKDQVATALRQRKADAVATPKVAVDPDIAQEAQLEERVERADAAAATEGSIVCTRMDTRSGRRRTVRLSASNF